MNRLKYLFSKSLLHFFWEEFLVRYRFKYVLPQVTQTVLDGISLDLSKLSLKVRNRILMGIYEGHEKRMCEEFLSPNDSVLEIGGAIGFIGLVCQKRIGIKSYVAFEANPQTLEVLRANYRLNGLNAVAFHLALAPSDGAIDLDVASDFWENSVLVSSKSSSSCGTTIRVPAASFRTLLRQGPPDANVLIIDVEGAEQFIDPEDIPARINKIIIELHPHVLGPEKTYNLIAGLIQKGFHVAQEESGTFAFVKSVKPESEDPQPPRWSMSASAPGSLLAAAEQGIS